MKNLVLIVSVYIVVGLLMPTSLKAQTNSGSNIFPEEAQGLDAARVDRPDRTVPQTSTEYALTGLLRTEGTSAGATMKDTKEMQGVAAPATADEGFSEPSAYVEYKFAQIQDERSIGLDGPQHNAIAGFDFVSYWKTIVGFNFTYTNEALSDNGAPGVAQLENSSESYFFSPYIAKNFMDWINVGGSFTYGRTDTTFRALSSAPFPGGAPITGLDTTQDSYAVSPFLGVSHTFGPWSFSSTTVYIWGYDHYSFDPAAPSGGAPAAPDAKTLNQTFLWLNNVQYAIDDKWAVSLQANWNRLLTTQAVQVAAGFPKPTFAHEWMSFGARADYTVNKDVNVFAAVEHDAFNSLFQDYRIRTGASYNF